PIATVRGGQRAAGHRAQGIRNESRCVPIRLSPYGWTGSASTAGLVLHLNLGLREEYAARRAGTPRGEKKLGLRIESDVRRGEMQDRAGDRYRLPPRAKLGRGR